MSKKLGGMQALQGTVREGLAELLGDPDDLIARIQGQVARSLSKDTVLTLADLPLLPPTASSVPAGIDNVLTGSAARAAQSQVDVQVMVQTSRPARVRVTVQVEDLNAFQQLSLF